jgi:hypothetical protein
VWAASGRASRSPGLVALGLVTAAEIVLFTTVVYANFLVENTEARALRITAGSAVAGLALTALLAAPLTSTFGAAGAMGALGLAAAGQGVGMSVMLSLRYGRSTRRLGARRYRRAVAEAFATVPYYREWWSEEGLGTPTDIEVAERRIEDLVPLRRSPAPADADHGLRALRRLGVAEVRVDDRHDLRRGLPSSAPAGAVVHDRLLGYVAVRGSCDHWHLAVPDLHGRELPDGVALTALRSRSVRLVDIRLDGVAGLEACPRHRTSVLRPSVPGP